MRSTPVPGDVVRARGGCWQVIDATAYGKCVLAELRGLDAANAGRRRLLLHPFDRLIKVDERRSTGRVSMRSWRRRFRVLAAQATPHDRLRAAAAARVDLLPWQIEPALAILSGKASRLLLADEVGMGKTVQSAFVIAELRERGLAGRVLILTPAGVKDQWAEELRTRFSIESTVVDGAGLAAAASRLPGIVNPWRTFAVAIASVDFVKRPEVLRALEPLVWDLLVVDEAHSAAGDTDRGRAVRAIAARSRRVLLLTATPHGGDERSFASLCDIGRLEGDHGIMVFRRRRAEAAFRLRRRVHLYRVRLSAAERRMHDALGGYSGAVWRSRAVSDTGARLAMMVLHKRACSGATTLARSLRRRIALLSVDSAPLPVQQSLFPLESADTDDADAEPDASLAAPGLDDPDKERRILDNLLALAEAARSDDSKLRRLAILLRRSREPAVVFTEYRDSAETIADFLSAAFTVALLHGGLGRVGRLAALGEFASRRASVLVTTDVASEGLNLQDSARLVVNVELPWNPMRLEQRVGRVDRMGQRYTVHAFHLVADGTAEESVLARLAMRLARAREALGSVPDTLGLPSETEMAGFVVGGALLPEVPETAFAAGSAPPETLLCDPCGDNHGRTSLPPTGLSELAANEVSRLTLVRTLCGCRLPRRAAAREDPTHPAWRRRGAGSGRRADLVLLASLRRSRLLRSARSAPAAPWLLRRPGLLYLFSARILDARRRLVEAVLVPVFAAVGPSVPQNLAEAFALGGASAGAPEPVARAALEAARSRLSRVGEQRSALSACERQREAAISWEIEAHMGRLAAPVQAGLFDRRAIKRREEARRLEIELRDDLHRCGPASAEGLTLAGDPQLEMVLIVR
ncbi:MAG: helicase-related protein [Vicinamibacterales bacterium]